MLNIGNKKYRNLQEQVGYNSEQIEKIFDILDGLAVTDNVVAIADLSDNLNADQLDIVEKAVAFLVYNNHVYLKRNEAAGYAYFDVVFSITGTTVITFASSEISVDLATGALAIIDSSKQTYSKTEIDTQLATKADISYVDAQLALKADLSGANFTGGITAPSIIEDMIGYSMSKYADDENATCTISYGGVVKNGNKLTIAVAGKIIRKAAITGKYIVSIGIPSDVGNKLIPMTGSTLSNQKMYISQSNTQGVDITVSLTKQSSSLLRVEFYKLADLTQDVEYTFRYEETFLLSANLAA